MIKLAAYLRVSTVAQADGFGLDVQQQTIASWARARQHRIAQWCRDEGISGAEGLDGRAGLATAIRATRTGQVQGIVVARLDRLARDLIVQESLLAEVRRAGGDVLTCAAAEAMFLADDPGDPSRKLIRQILGSISEYERALIRLRLAAGRSRKAQEGGYAYGSPPFGFRAEAGALVVDDEEQRAVSQIVGWRRAGCSYPEVVRRLEASGLRPKRGSRWHVETVRRIVARAERKVSLEDHQ